MKKLLLVILLIPFFGCVPQQSSDSKEGENGDDFQYVSERFKDIQVLRYQVPGFEELSLKEKKLIYYLSKAALSGRDIIYDQNFKHNLTLRRTLEAVLKQVDDQGGEEWEAFETYAKRVFFANGIHHHYSYDKFQPDFSEEYFSFLLEKTGADNLPLQSSEDLASFTARMTPIIFDPSIAPKKVNKATGIDHVKQSAVNFYEGVSEAEVKAFYQGMKSEGDETPISYGLNSKVVKENGTIVEKVWKMNGMYGEAIKEIVFWLEKAAGVAENEEQQP